MLTTVTVDISVSSISGITIAIIIIIIIIITIISIIIIIIIIIIMIISWVAEGPGRPAWLACLPDALGAWAAYVCLCVLFQINVFMLTYKSCLSNLCN